jgi:hypothetical protein
MESKEKRERNEAPESNVEYNEESIREKSALLESEISGEARLEKLLQ